MELSVGIGMEYSITNTVEFKILDAIY